MKTPLLLALAALAYSPLSAQTSQPDTARTQTLEEALVVASPKEHALLRQMPASVSALEGEQLAENGVQAVKGLSAVAPNLYIPDYGSRLSSSLYVRGVGSRVGTPAVGLYVDDIPYADKSTFDFDFVDVARVEVLRGPQGTLYGRGAMGGLIKVYSAEPREDHRTRIGLGATTRITGRRVSASTSHKIGNAFRLSLAAYYKGDNGFQRNSTTGRKADAQDAGGAALKADWRIGERWRTTFSADYQYADQRSNPYVYEGTAVEGGEEAFPALIGKISQNRQSNYRRSLVNAANKTEYLAPKVRLTNILAYQYLTDRLFMDQDYIAADIFSLEQKQWRNGVSDELSLKGELGRWQWTAGAFFLHEHKRTTCPVTFYGDGVAYLNGQFASVMPEFVSIAFSENEIPFFATLKSTGWNGAIFHQSTVRDLFAKGLSLTAGLRLDYDRHSLALQSSDQAYAYNFGLAMMGRTLSQDFAADALLSGDDHQTTWQLLPKIALDYQFGCGHVYATVAKGYRSGGYNLENYSDLSQAVLRRNMMLQVADYSEQTISAMPLPEESKQRAISGMKGSILANLPEQPEIAALAYKPEFSWNYEVGAHLDFFEKSLALDAAVFLQTAQNLQIARYSQSWFGREIVNAGNARSYGVELSLQARLLERRLAIDLAYGLAHSTFTDYETLLSDGTTADYDGNRVPYAPLHTLALSLSYRQAFGESAFVRALTYGASLTGAGNIYWDEANTFSSPLALQLGARIAAELPAGVSVALRGDNLTDHRFQTFAFTSMSRRFSQYSLPLRFSLDLTWDF